MFVLIFYVPCESKDKVKHSCFGAGAGKLGYYDQCCFETLGVGQFRPLNGSNPSVGKQGEVEFVEEVRVEMIVPKAVIAHVVRALKEAHPYEEVAYHIYETFEFEDIS